MPDPNVSSTRSCCVFLFRTTYLKLSKRYLLSIVIGWNFTISKNVILVAILEEIAIIEIAAVHDCLQIYHVLIIGFGHKTND